MKPNFIETLNELNAGIFASKLSQAMAKVAIGTVQNSKKGKLILTLDFDQIGETSQVNISHKLTYSQPTKRGKSMEEDTTATPMYVGRDGHLTIAPENQLDLFKNNKDTTNA